MNRRDFIDAARWALGIDTFPETVQCSGGSYFPKGGDFEWPDVFESSFKYPNGKMISFDLTCHGRTRLMFDDQTATVVYGETLHIDPQTGDCLSKTGADKWAREYEKGWELA